MADKKTQAVVKTVEFKLPSGAKVFARKPNNGDRRVLLEAPEFNRQQLMEVLACTCIVKIDFQKGHEFFPDGHSMEFSTDDKTDVQLRLDEVGLEDAVAYVEAFGATNWPSEATIKTVIDAVKASKK